MQHAYWIKCRECVEVEAEHIALGHGVGGLALGEEQVARHEDGAAHDEEAVDPLDQPRVGPVEEVDGAEGPEREEVDRSRRGRNSLRQVLEHGGVVGVVVAVLGRGRVAAVEAQDGVGPDLALGEQGHGLGVAAAVVARVDLRRGVGLAGPDGDVVAVHEVEQAEQVLDGRTHIAEARAVGDQGRHLDVGVLEQQLDGLHVVRVGVGEDEDLRLRSGLGKRNREEGEEQERRGQAVRGGRHRQG